MRPHVTRVGLMLAAIGWIGPMQAHAQSLEQHVGPFVAAFNAADSARLAQFFEDRSDPGADITAEIRRWQRWRSIYGPMTVSHAVLSDSLRHRVFLHGTTTGGWLELTFHRSRTSPGRLRNIAAGTGLRPDIPDSSVKVGNDHELATWLGHYVSSLATDDLFSGTVLVARGRAPLFVRSEGWANRSQQVPNTDSTSYNLGSITKVMTAVATLRQADAGRLDLDAPAASYLADYPGGLDPRITVRHLLTYASGLGRGAFDTLPVYPRALMSMTDLLPLTVAEPEFAPGEDQRYGNSGYLVLGRLLEHVAGMPFHDLVEQTILAPAGMHHSGFYELDDPPPFLALGYSHIRYVGSGVTRFDPRRRRNSLFMEAPRGSSAGGLYASAPDLFGFATLLRHGVLVSDSMRALMLATPPGALADGANPTLGYGLMQTRLPGGHVAWKDGGSWGLSTRMDLYIEPDLTVIVLSNYDSIANVMADRIREVLLVSGMLGGRDASAVPP